MKTYHVTYLWTGGERSISKQNLPEFLSLMEEIINNPQVLQESIELSTTENK